MIGLRERPVSCRNLMTKNMNHIGLRMLFELSEWLR